MLCRNMLCVHALPIALLIAGSAFLLQGDKKPAGQEHGKPGEMQGDGMNFPMPQPTPEHASLKKAAGVWDAVVRHSMASGAPMMESKGVSTDTMLGEFWLIEDFKFDMNGMQFTGHGVNGYDAKAKKFIGTWCDSMSPELVLMEGTADEKTHVVTMTGEMTDMTGKRVKARMTSESKDDNNRLFSMYLPGPDGKEWKCMSIEYKRRK